MVRLPAARRELTTRALDALGRTMRRGAPTGAGQIEHTYRPWALGHFPGPWTSQTLLSVVSPPSLGVLAQRVLGASRETP